MDKELIKGLIAEYQQFVKSVSFVKRAVTLSDNFNYVFVGLSSGMTCYHFQLSLLFSTSFSISEGRLGKKSISVLASNSSIVTSYLEKGSLLL